MVVLFMLLSALLLVALEHGSFLLLPLLVLCLPVWRQNHQQNTKQMKEVLSFMLLVYRSLCQ